MTGQEVDQIEISRFQGREEMYGFIRLLDLGYLLKKEGVLIQSEGLYCY